MFTNQRIYSSNGNGVSSVSTHLYQTVDTDTFLVDEGRTTLFNKYFISFHNKNEIKTQILVLFTNHTVSDRRVCDPHVTNYPVFAFVS